MCKFNIEIHGPALAAFEIPNGYSHLCGTVLRKNSPCVKLLHCITLWSRESTKMGLLLMTESQSFLRL